MWWAEIWAICDSSQKAELLPRVVTPRSLVSDLLACVEEVQLGGKGPFLCLEQVFASRACLTPDHRQPGNDPGMGGNGTIEEAFPASKNYDLKQRLGWVGLG